MIPTPRMRQSESIKAYLENLSEYLEIFSLILGNKLDFLVFCRKLGMMSICSYFFGEYFLNKPMNYLILSKQYFFITLPDGFVLFQVMDSDDQDASTSLEHALLNRNRLQTLVELEGDIKARIHEYNSLIDSLNEWLKSKLFSHIIGKPLDKAKEYFQPIFEREIQEARQGHKEFIRRMVFEDQFVARIDVNLPENGS